MSSAPTYKNPFAQYNANLMTPDEILAYWCSPLFSMKASGVDEKQVFTDPQPIVFAGGRGTGKTMFLRYFSHEVQVCFYTSLAGRKTDLLQHMIDQGGVGIYVRLDGALVRDFTGKGVSDEAWNALFSHYFELHVCQRYVELLRSWYKEGVVGDEETKEFVDALCRHLEVPGNDKRTLDYAVQLIDDRIKEVRDFRAAVSFKTISFQPSKALAAGDLTFTIPKILSQVFPKLPQQFRFIVLIDEYENFSVSQQRVLNSFLKFPTEHAAFRVGMRLEGFHTTETVSQDEFIKVGRDYLSVVFEDVLTKDKGYQAFLREVASKRLTATPLFKENDWCDIRRFLGAKEDLEEEARDLVKEAKNNTRHLANVLNKLPHQAQQSAIKELRCPPNPLLETLNALWITKGRSVEETSQAMRDYLSKRKTELGAKYRRDYVDKYKLSLMFLLASRYKKDKLYYSFNTFCFLSSGIVGNFLELCRRAFQVAAFEDQQELLEKGRIAPRLQHMAAQEVAKSELDMIARIRDHGIRLSHFANSLGNCFREYHLDPRLRYPETNQLAVDLSTVSSPADQQAFRAAIRWSVIQRKPRLQGSAPGKGKAELYTLNRILSPIFQISYRTRGGASERISGERLAEFLSSDGARSSLQSRDTDKSVSGSNELSLFPLEPDD